MMNLIIAEDEPLVRAGIQSMISWEEYGVNVIGVAENGARAWEMIEKESPEIVITDIKMPVMSGLELARRCHEEGRALPVFIILTSYEEFQFVKEALTYQVVDYLIKLELTAGTLVETLKRAIDKVAQIRAAGQFAEPSSDSAYLLREQFFTRLVLNLFESEQQMISQAEYLNIRLDYAAYAACYVEIASRKQDSAAAPELLTLYANSVRVAEELIPKYVPCYVLSLDTGHFGVVFFLEETVVPDYRGVIRKALEQVSDMLYSYYGAVVCASVGAPVAEPMQAAASYQDAKQISSHLTPESPILFFEDVPCGEPLKNVFNMSLFKEDIRKAYAEFDEKALYDIFTSIIEIFEREPSHYVQALDAAGTMLHLSLSLLGNGEQAVSDIFAEYNGGYRSLYGLTSVEQIMEWLKVFRDGLCENFAAHNRDNKNHIVVQVKRYIDEHIREKITLNKVAEVFGISPNYLSVLFSKYNDMGFTDYINQEKIEAAKKMMADGEYKIYEISDLLGFESAFYFSRVFKKVTGVSPRDYMNNNF